MALIEINWRPSNKDLRVFAFIQLIATALIAWFLQMRSWGSLIPIGLMALSICVFIWGLVQPQILRPLFVAWMIAAFPIGWILSHVVLAIVYYGVLTPIGLIQRLNGRDALRCKPCPGATTFWQVRPKPPEPSRYFRQF